MIEPLTNETVLWLAVIVAIGLVAIVDRVASIFRPDERDDDLDDRIERAIGDATRDLLDALGEANTTLDAIREQASEHVRQNANLITLVDQATTRTGRMSYAPTDLIKPE